MTQRPTPTAATTDATFARELLKAAGDVRRLFPRGGFDGWGATAMQVLIALWANGAMTIGALQESLEVSQSLVSREVAGLVEAGLVVQETDADDARVRNQGLTGKGSALAGRYLTWAKSRLGE
jgi:DNA-binding MarR family transcriptional regulator